MNNRLVIIVLSYNRVNWLEECVQSFLAQTYKDFKLTVLDNASDQDIEGMIGTFKDSRVSLVRNERNLGIVGNYEKAWDMAGGDFFMIFHDDDCAHPRLLESQMRIFVEVPDVLFVLTGVECVKEHSKMMQFQTEGDIDYEVLPDYRALAKRWLGGMSTGFCSTMYRTRVVQGMRPVRESLVERFSLCADKPLLISIAQKGQCAYLRYPAYNARQHESQDSQRLMSEYGYMRETLRFYREVLEGAWDAVSIGDFERNATMNLIYTYGAWLRSSSGDLRAVVKDLLEQDLIRPLKFLRWSVRLAAGGLGKRARKSLKALVPVIPRSLSTSEDCKNE